MPLLTQSGADGVAAYQGRSNEATFRTKQGRAREVRCHRQGLTDESCDASRDDCTRSQGVDALTYR